MDPESGGGMVNAGDAASLERLRQGDERELSRLFGEHYPLLVAVARRLASDDVAEEIVQEVFLSLWDRRATLDVRGSLKRYLLSAVRFAAASIVRHRGMADRRVADLVALHPVPEPADAWVLQREQADALARAIAQLPPRGREAFTLVRLDGLSYADAGAALGISPRTVEVHVGRAMQALRRMLLAHQG